MSVYLYSDKYTKLHVFIIVTQYLDYICKSQMPFTTEYKNVNGKGKGFPFQARLWPRGWVEV